MKENNMKKVVILGAGGLGREVLDVFMAHNAVKEEYEVLGFIDEKTEMKGKELNGYPVLGSFDYFSAIDTNSVYAICGVGRPAVRRKMARKAEKLGLKFCSIIHPSAILTPFVSLGTGVVITAGCIITNQVKIGNHVYVNLNVTIGHDSVLNDFCNIAPGCCISGDVHVGTGCHIGTGTSTIQGVNIGEWSIVGAGTVIIRDVPSNATVVGVPAKVIKTRAEEWYKR